jgi:hypothetical protein
LEEQRIRCISARGSPGLRRRSSNVSGVNERARRMEKRLEWPMLVAALLVVPAIAIEQSEATGALNTVAVVIN